MEGGRRGSVRRSRSREGSGVRVGRIRLGSSVGGDRVARVMAVAGSVPVTGRGREGLGVWALILRLAVIAVRSRRRRRVIVRPCTAGTPGRSGAVRAAIGTVGRG